MYSVCVIIPVVEFVMASEIAKTKEFSFLNSSPKKCNKSYKYSKVTSHKSKVMAFLIRESYQKKHYYHYCHYCH